MSSAFSMQDTMLAYASMRSEAGAGSADEVSELQMMGSMMAASRVNDLAALKRWLDNGESGMEDYSRGIGYTYGIVPQIYLMEGDGYRQVNPDQTMAAFGLDMSDNLSQTLSTYNAGEVFYALPENSSLYEDDYQVLAGSWPKKDTDCVLVLTGSGGIPDFLLYTMGLKDVSVLNSQIEGIVSGTKTTDTTLEASAVYEPEEFLGISFRLLPACNAFAYDEKLGLWIDRSFDEEVVRRLEAYNAVMEENGYEDKVISYTDYVAVLTSSVTTIIDVITYVLIAFVAVSLIVSSIMIGIITYISVLERRKEIGVLRAMGASKRNIAEVFNAETFIIGLMAGTIGVIMTLLLHIPINYLISTVTDQDVYAYLPLKSGVILIILCVALTVIGGFIPSRKAARQDPVAALRSE